MTNNKRECPPHVGNGWECLVAHYDGPNGTVGPGCPQCKFCGHYFRPQKYEDDCESCKADDNLAAGLCPKGHKLEPHHERKDVRKCEPCKLMWGDRWMGTLT